MANSQSERQEPMGSAVGWRAADKSILSALPPKNSEPWEHGHIGQSFYWGVMLTQAMGQDPYAQEFVEIDAWIQKHLGRRSLAALFGKAHGMAAVRAVQRRIYVMELPDCLLINYGGERWKLREKDAEKALAFDRAHEQIHRAEEAENGSEAKKTLPPEVLQVQKKFKPTAGSKRARDLLEWALLFAERLADRAKDPDAALRELDEATLSWGWGSKIRAKKEAENLRLAVSEVDAGAGAKSRAGDASASIAGDPPVRAKAKKRRPDRL